MRGLAWKDVCCRMRIAEGLLIEIHSVETEELGTQRLFQVSNSTNVEYNVWLCFHTIILRNKYDCSQGNTEACVRGVAATNYSMFTLLHSIYCS